MLLTGPGSSDYALSKEESQHFAAGTVFGDNSIEPLKQALLLAQAAVDKKAVFPALLEVTDLVSYADYLLIVTGTSKPHIDALISSCCEVAKANSFPHCRQEGLEMGKWVLVDFGDVILHAFLENERGYYDLEGLWRDAPRVDIPGVKTLPNPMDYHVS